MNFFKVTPKFFEAGRSYSFRIFLFDLSREIRVNSVIENSELTGDIIEEWDKYIEKGARLEVHAVDLDSLCIEALAQEEDIKKLNQNYYDCLDIYNERLENYSHIVEQEFDIKSCIQSISQQNNFMTLINRVKAEVLCFDLTVSESVSICTSLVEKIFLKDIMPARIASLSYYLAKVNGIEDPRILSDIIMAALLRDVGHNMIRRTLFENEDLNESSFYLKHPMLSIYILSKTGVEFDKNIKRYILEHHEQSDGSGFPRQKKEKQINLCSFIINMAQQIIEFYSKELKEGEGPTADRLTHILWIMRKQGESEGFNTSFPQTLCDSLLKIIKLENS